MLLHSILWTKQVSVSLTVNHCESTSLSNGSWFIYVAEENCFSCRQKKLSVLCFEGFGGSIWLGIHTERWWSSDSDPLLLSGVNEPVLLPCCSLVCIARLVIDLLSCSSHMWYFRASGDSGPNTSAETERSRKKSQRLVWIASLINLSSSLFLRLTNEHMTSCQQKTSCERQTKGLWGSNERTQNINITERLIQRTQKGNRITH